MPTGHTYELLENNQTFEQFALNCARSFGALIDMRDEPMDAPVPEAFDASDYHATRIAEAQAKVARLEAMTEGERLEFGASEIAKEIESLLDAKAKQQAENNKLESMFKQAQEWTPPTPDHEPLKRFMIDQCRISIHSFDYLNERLDRCRNEMPSERWESCLAKARRDIAYHTEANTKGIERAEANTRWVRELRKSLSNAAPPPAGAER